MTETKEIEHDRTDALAAIFESPEPLKDIDRDAIDDRHESRLTNALEQLDEIVLDLTPDELVSANRHRSASTADGDDTDTTAVTVELTPALVELIGMVSDDGDTVGEWLRRTARERFAVHDQQYWNSVTVPVEVDLPPETARWARLWRQHYEATDGDHNPVDVETELLDYIDLDLQ